MQAHITALTNAIRKIRLSSDYDARPTKTACASGEAA